MLKLNGRSQKGVILATKSTREKPDRTTFYLGADDLRSHKLERIRQRLSLRTASETMRRLIDLAYDELYPEERQLKLKF